MIDRIFRNWKTSLLGVAIIITTLVMVFKEVATLTEVGGFWAVALVLLYVKDGQKK